MSFPAYSAYKDSGNEWIGAIPDHWLASPLKRAFIIQGGSTPTPDEVNWDGDIAWVTPADLSSLSSLFIEASKRTITATGLASCGTTLLPAGSLILSTRAPIGSLAIGLFSMCTNQGCKGLVPNANASVAYFAFVLLTAKGELNNRGRGSTFLEISGDELSRFNVPMPPFAEQTQIARFLDHETARIDALIEEQQRLIELLKEKRQAVISHAVTQGLDPTVPMKDSGVEWLGEVPAHWSVVPFGLAFGYQEGPGIMAADFRDEGVPLVRISGVQGRWVTLQGCNYLDPAKVNGKWGHFRLEHGDLIISGSASMGLVSEVGEEAIGAVAYTGLIRLTPKIGISDRDFIRSVVGSYQFFAQIDLLKAGSTIQHFGPTHLSQMKVVLPPLDEQIKVAAYVDRTSIQFAQLLDDAGKNNDILQERRAALISAAVTGKIDVRGWQPPTSAPSPESAQEAI